MRDRSYGGKEKGKLKEKETKDRDKWRFGEMKEEEKIGERKKRRMRRWRTGRKEERRKGSERWYDR